MPLKNNNERQGPRRRRRAVVRLDTQALWERLALLSRSQNWLAREVAEMEGRHQPRIPVHAGQRGPRPFGTRAPTDAEGPGNGGFR